MPVKHIRIDDRLIHGQVLIGWVSRYNYDTLLICDEELANSEWEKEMYLAAVPGDMKGDVIVPGDMQNYVDSHPEDKILLLLKSPAALARLVNAGFPVEDVIIGGIHDKAGRKHYYDFMFLSGEEVELLRELIKKGIHIVCQDLPDHPSHELSSVLDKSV